VINYYNTCENVMTDEEWQQLVEMREYIHSSNIQAFDSEYIESFAQLLAKSLQGKGDAIRPPIY
jgi:hypothetical protein